MQIFLFSDEFLNKKDKKMYELHISKIKTIGSWLNNLHTDVLVWQKFIKWHAQVKGHAYITLLTFAKYWTNNELGLSRELIEITR